MASGKATTVRARVREEMTNEIKIVARQHLGVEGANLSLRAVAREMGMASSALYRYFASRDDLLTALIVDAYNSFGEAAENADDENVQPAQRWIAVAKALRQWALNHPHEYALIFGSPVPGYKAPQDTIGPATRTVKVLGRILAANPPISRPGDEIELPPTLEQPISNIAEMIQAGALSTPAMARALAAWMHILGSISFELFGQLNNTIERREEWFEYQTRVMTQLIGLKSE
ncbi:MAG: TetR/AcrR family transcriptional regulator [Corynebacteriales bacterium]|nr:TetR/AcrR family transcriptional regulator [Mycobacteriales bacterium]